MQKTKESIIIGFVIFASLFGAGNLILPPYLGFNAGHDWPLVAFGFFLSAIVIPIMAVMAHAKVQGTMLDFANKVSSGFSLIFCTSIYIIAVCLPIPRTASVTHEIAIAPFFGTSSLSTSSIYFGLVFLFVMKRKTILDILGKYLTPIIILILLAIITIGVFHVPDDMKLSIDTTPIISGLMEGYQTYDALGGLLIGGVVIISLNLKQYSHEDKRKLIVKGGVYAAIGLFIIYGGLIFIGARYSTALDSEMTRTELLTSLSAKTLGQASSLFLSVLVALACFTTAVSVIVGAADFFKGLYNDSEKTYVAITAIACVVGILIGQLGVAFIIKVAVPALLLIYPITIVLILLNLLNESYASKAVFRVVVFITFLFAIPDFMKYTFPTINLQELQNSIPLANFNLGWVFPALFAFCLVNIYNYYAIKKLV